MNQRVPLVGLNSDHSRSNILHVADSLLIYAFHFNLHCAVQGFIWIGEGGGIRPLLELVIIAQGVRTRPVMPPKLFKCQLLAPLDKFF